MSAEGLEPVAGEVLWVKDHMSQMEGRALVVEDDRSWQGILAEIVTDLGLHVDVADSLPAALARLRSAQYGLAIVDLSLGGSDHHNQDGLAVLDAIRCHAAACPAILLTGYATVELAVSALTEHAAYTCLRKETFRRADFRNTVHQALSMAALRSLEPQAAAGLAGLTAREHEVLRLLAQGLTNKEIAQALVISVNTVKRHLKSVFAKLDVDTRAAAVAKAVSRAALPGQQRPADLAPADRRQG